MAMKVGAYHSGGALDIEEVRRWAEGRIYGSIEEKVKAVNDYLRELQSDPGRVRSLAGWDWLEDAVQSLPSHYAHSAD